MKEREIRKAIYAGMENHLPNQRLTRDYISGLYDRFMKTMKGVPLEQIDQENIDGFCSGAIFVYNNCMKNFRESR